MADASRDHAQAQILLVDDDPSVLSGLRRVLHGEPWRVFCATSAADALVICERERIDVVVSDYNMPGAKGTELLEAVRRAYPQTARFMLTGQASLDIALDAINRGAVTRFFEKPCDVGQLLAAIRDALSVSSLGALAGSVAHDLNNLLTVIEGRSGLVLRRPDLQPELRKDAEVIQRVVRQSASLTRRLLGAVRTPQADESRLDLNALLGDLQDLLAGVLGGGVELALLLEPGLGQIAADGVALEQVFVNLAVNARDAMPEGGRFTVATTNWDGEDTVASLPAGRWALVMVSDTGVGMPSDVRERAFDDGFTTKSRGGGIGLGLPTVARIMREHRGHVTLSSEPGRGTTFMLYFPRADVAAGADPAASTASRIPTVVDDGMRASR